MNSVLNDDEMENTTRPKIQISDIDETVIDAETMALILKRQQDYKDGLVSSRPWEEVKQELLNRRKQPK